MREMTNVTRELLTGSDYLTTVRDPDGKLISVTSAQALSEDSYFPDVNANNGLFRALMTFFSCAEKSGPLPMLWINMIAVMPCFVRPKAAPRGAIHIPRFPLFKMINPYHVSNILDAVMRGEEKIAIRAIDQNPQALLQQWEIKNHLGITPLDVAVMATDVQMIERMKPYFERLTEDAQGNRIDGLAEFYRQIKGMYKKSLSRYCEIQRAKIDTLLAQQNNGQAMDVQALETARARLAAYLQAIKVNTFKAIYKTHQQAQEHNAFDFQPYFDAIVGADDMQFKDAAALTYAQTPEEIQAAIAKGVSPIEIGFTDQDGRRYTREEVQALTFDQLTLIQKMNRFREKFVAHMQQEIIYNPYHILCALGINPDVWNGLMDGPGFMRFRANFISAQSSYMERTAPEAVKQDFRQGIWWMKKYDHPRKRPSLFDDADILKYDKSLCDISCIEGWGYSFDISGVGERSDHFGRSLDSRKYTSAAFSDIVLKKYNGLKSLMLGGNSQSKLTDNCCVVM